MRKTKRFLMAVVALALFLGFPKGSYASASMIEKKVPVLLQINEYDVLYTYPKQPYLDKNNRLMVPLRAVSELIGGKVSYNPTQKTALIQMNNKDLQITAGSKSIQVNNVARRMDTVPVLYQQSFFIPVRALIDNLNLPVIIDPNTGLVHISSESMDKNQTIEFMKESDLSPADIADHNAILPLSYDLTLNNNGSGELQNGRLHIQSKNISGKVIAEGKEDLHVIFLFDKAFQMEADSNTTDQNNERPRPKLGLNEIFNRTVSFTASNDDEKLRYILAVGRVFK